MQEILAGSWEAIREGIRGQVGEGRFNLWVKNTVFRAKEGKVVEVGTPSIFIKEWLIEHYAGIIESCIRKATGAAPSLRFVVDPDLAKRFQAAQEEEEEEEGEGRGASEEPAPARDEASISATLGLKQDYRFDNFVLGACNRLAHAGARSVCEEAGTLYNPLFIYGASGLGKTHILQAVAREYAVRNGPVGVLYLSCESFINKFIEGLKHRELNSFRDRFRKVRFLVVDDVHLLSHKEATQEEFLHTFNACFNQRRQIIMASDSHPNAIASLRRELKGRFIGGLLARLDPPSYMTRLEILREKALRLPLHIPDEALAFLAHHIRSNVRVLEGALTSLVARASLLHEPLSVKDAALALRTVEEKKERFITLGDVEDAVVTHFGISSQDLHSKSRKRCYLLPRQVCMNLARQLTSHSLKEIGQYFGKRNHVTVLYALKKVEEATAADPDFARVLKVIEEKARRPETWIGR